MQDKLIETLIVSIQVFSVFHLVIQSPVPLVVAQFKIRQSKRFTWLKGPEVLGPLQTSYFILAESNSMN